MKEKIMHESTLDSVVGRLAGCIAMLAVVHANLDSSDNTTEALYGCIDLLEAISRDFEADIRSAKVFVPSEETAA